MDTNIITVERIQEYINLKPEADWRIKETEPASNWPQRGHVKFTNFSLRYRDDLELVLKGIDCEITPGEKVKNINLSIIFFSFYRFTFNFINLYYRLGFKFGITYDKYLGLEKILTFDNKVLQTDFLYIISTLR